MTSLSTQQTLRDLAQKVPAAAKATYIGKGRFGTVFSAGSYAYKVGRPMYLSNELQVLRAMHEVQSHAHLVPLLAWWQTSRNIVLKFPLFTTNHAKYVITNLFRIGKYCLVHIKCVMIVLL